MLQRLFVNDLDPERLARSRNRPVTQRHRPRQRHRRPPTHPAPTDGDGVSS